MITKATQKQTERQESIDYIRRTLNQGDTVYTVLRNVAKSGMSRQISLFVVKDGELLNITWHAARALDYSLTEQNPGRNWAIRVGGAGMDMGFHLVYSLSRLVFANVVDPERKDPGYNLNHRWL